MTSLSVLLLLAPLTIAPPQQRLDMASRQVESAYDTSRGGFVARDGRPSESSVELALRLAADATGSAWRERGLFTVAWTRGLLDTMGGGYIVGAGRRDAETSALSKRADFNGRRLENLLRAHRITGAERYLEEARAVTQFMDRILADGRGGFVSAQVGDQDLEPAVNGHAIRAWLLWAAQGAHRARRDFALRSLDRVWETCWTPRLGLVRRNSFGDLLTEPRLDDQVEMGRAYILAAQLCGRPADGVRARAIGDHLLASFQDAGRGGFRRTAMPKKNGSLQRAPQSPEENARAVLFLHELAHFTGESAFRTAADRATEAHAKAVTKLGLDAADWALAALAALDPEQPVAPSWARAEEPAPERPRSMRFKPRR